MPSGTVSPSAVAVLTVMLVIETVRGREGGENSGALGAIRSTAGSEHRGTSRPRAVLCGVEEEGGDVGS